MIIKTPYGVSPSIELYISGAAVDYETINAFELELSENKHDMLVLEISGIPPKAITEYWGKPVRLEFRTGANFHHSFYGYVEDIRPFSFTGFGLVNRSPFQTARIVCMGASYNMRGSTSRHWFGYRVSSIAKEIGHKHRFSVDAPSDEYVDDTLVQTNESDWQFLVRYANSLGYKVNSHGTHLHIYRPDSALSRQSSYHVLSTLISKQADIDAAPGNIMEFSGSFSRRNIDGDYKESEIAVIGKDNSLYNLRSSTLSNGNGSNRFPNRMDDYADNVAQGNRRLKQEDRSSYDYYADARVIGVAGCVPGGVVLVDQYASDFDGFWYVQSVKHIVNSRAYVTELRLAKNKNTEMVFDGTAPFQPPPKPYYDFDQWVSTKARFNEYQ